MPFDSPAGSSGTIRPAPGSWGPAAPLPGPRALPGPGEVAVWLLHIPGSVRAAADRDGVLDAEERGRAARLRDGTHRERYRASHVGLRMLLAGYLGGDPADIRFVREPCGMPECDEPHGRPAVAGHPGLHFSMSHAADAALYAVAADAVGADIDALRIRRGGAALLGHLHPLEQAAIAALPEELREEAFLGCWVRKEAYLKGIGTGLPGGIRSNHVGLPAGLAPGGPPGPAGWAITDVEAPDGYRAAVAVRTPEPAAGPPVVTLGRMRLA
ncbi:4'-phosphopantetheinyl transferase family protein [Streptomyces sp. NPDC018031]|uniref:4'-phosphopantetheinyl transferase family protein n=1 Tax=Streptomyces sp. NPDC018031 TaxID=3365033 RepID=UPI0037940A3D